MNAQNITRDEICTRFLDALPFDPYPFQEEALLAWFETDDGTLVTAPTGMGKTLIAEAAIFEALAGGTKLYYTTPLIALSDQKFREFQDRAEAWGFSRDDVGLITGNRKVNPDASVKIVVAEILLNHLLSEEHQLQDVSAVVMDEFHYFNDWDRGVVWELSLVLLPKSIRLMLLSATVGNTRDFAQWLHKEYGRKLTLVESDDRKIPLEFEWVGDKLLTEQLPFMRSDDDEECRSPALVFCFNREGCWSIAEKLKGAKLIGESARDEIEKQLPRELFADGIGPKLRQMLMRGIGVHHAGVLPKYKEIIESLFLQKLIPFVICTETLAAGINLPARSVVLHALLKGRRGEKKLVAPSAAHQMFGRAGRPQFDSKGYVYALAHDDDVKIDKWRKKYDAIDPKSKDPGILRARKQLERKKPSRRKTEQYWTEGQFESLINAGSAKLVSRAMIPYNVLIYLLTRSETLDHVRDFLSKRFNQPERLKKFQEQLDYMIDNLVSFGFLTKNEDASNVVLDEKIQQLKLFRSVDPLYGSFLSAQLHRADFQEKLQALESVLPIPPVLERKTGIPELEPGPLQTEVLQPTLLKMGIVLSSDDGEVVRPPDEEDVDYWEEPAPARPLTLAEMLKSLYDAKLATPESILIQPKWVLGGILEFESEFYKFVRAKDLIKDEGLILRHLLRLTILAGEFLAHSDGDPDYEQIANLATGICQNVDQRYTERFLESAEEAKANPIQQ